MRRVSMIIRAHLIGALCTVVLSLVALSAQGVLMPVLEGQAVYDADRDITWVADANLADREPFALLKNTVPVSNDDFPVGSDGRMTWDNAHLWIAAMNTASYLGANDWRLPISVEADPTCLADSNGIGYGPDCTASEMGHLYNVEGVTSSSMGPFSYVQANRYWSGTESSLDSDSAWFFSFDADGEGGSQYGTTKASAYPVFAVRDGDIRLIPEPATSFLLASGLAGLAAVRRRRA